MGYLSISELGGSYQPAFHPTQTLRSSVQTPSQHLHGSSTFLREQKEVKESLGEALRVQEAEVLPRRQRQLLLLVGLGVAVDIIGVVEEINWVEMGCKLSFVLYTTAYFHRNSNARLDLAARMAA